MSGKSTLYSFNYEDASQAEEMFALLSRGTSGSNIRVLKKGDTLVFVTANPFLPKVVRLTTRYFWKLKKIVGRLKEH